MDEWRQYVQGDPEFRMPGTGGADFADWIVEPSRWLGWMDGEICTKRPDALFMTKLQAVARKLGATVQDDDGRTYNDPKTA